MAYADRQISAVFCSLPDSYMPFLVGKARDSSRQDSCYSVLHCGFRKEFQYMKNKLSGGLIAV